MVVKTMSVKVIQNISPWHTYPSCTWEVLRRIESYKNLYKSLDLQGFETISLGRSASCIVSHNYYPEFEKYGLLFPADPELSAVNAPVFWHPNRFQNVVRFLVIPEDKIDPNGLTINISEFPAHRTHFKAPDGAHHIRFLGEKFWFQLRCADLNLVDENVYIGIEIDRVNDLEKRLKTVSQIAGIYDGSIDISAPLHTPKRPDLHESSTRVYDIRAAGGTWKDAINAHFGEDYLKNDPDEFQSARTTVRNNYTRVESYIYGKFLKILDQT